MLNLFIMPSLFLRFGRLHMGAEMEKVQTNALVHVAVPHVAGKFDGATSGCLARPANMKDYAVRMGEWFDHYLEGAPAPDWMKEGVPRLRMEEHLRDRKPAAKA